MDNYNGQPYKLGAFITTSHINWGTNISCFGDISTDASLRLITEGNLNTISSREPISALLSVAHINLGSHYYITGFISFKSQEFTEQSMIQDRFCMVVHADIYTKIKGL